MTGSGTEVVAEPAIPSPYFDVHVHLPSVGMDGLRDLLQHLESDHLLRGANLILNSREEVAFVSNHVASLPSTLNIIPYYGSQEAAGVSDKVLASGWFKVHPRLHHIELDDVPRVCETIATGTTRPRGLIVDCFPWGPDLRYAVALPLVIGLAQALPDVPVLATHGGGYESWALRAHTVGLKNVMYDFSATAYYYSGSDVLGPLRVYLQHGPERVLFGSDWPLYDPRSQFKECSQIASRAGLSADHFALLTLENALRLWPPAAH